MEQEPTIGHIVHYVFDDIMDEHLPAIVVKSGGDVVDLQVFTAGTETMWKAEVEYDEDYRSTGTWHWPERES